ncbi:RNA-dependent RNA polymerase family protein, partial [Prunus dulcis]
RAPPATGGGVRTAVESPTFPDPSPPAARLCWPKITEKLREFTETSRPPISLLRPPFPSTQAPGPGRPAGEIFRRSSELGPGAVACTRHPPPGHRNFRAFWLKNVGMGDSAEISVEVKVKILRKMANRSFVPDICQVSDTHGFDSNSKAEFDSGPVSADHIGLQFTHLWNFRTIFNNNGKRMNKINKGKKDNIELAVGSSFLLLDLHKTIPAVGAVGLHEGMAARGSLNPFFKSIVVGSWAPHHMGGLSWAVAFGLRAPPNLGPGNMSGTIHLGFCLDWFFGHSLYMVGEGTTIVLWKRYVPLIILNSQVLARFSTLFYIGLGHRDMLLDITHNREN